MHYVFGSCSLWHNLCAICSTNGAVYFAHDASPVMDCLPSRFSTQCRCERIFFKTTVLLFFPARTVLGSHTVRLWVHLCFLAFPSDPSSLFQTSSDPASAAFELEVFHLTEIGTKSRLWNILQLKQAACSASLKWSTGFVSPAVSELDPIPGPSGPRKSLLMKSRHSDNTACLSSG